MAESATPELPFLAEPEERWLPVPGWEELYAVSDLGRVRVLDRIVTAPTRWGGTRQWLQRGRILKPGRTGAGGRPKVYLHVQLQRDGEAFNRGVHILVLEAFAGPRPEGMVCCHGPGGSLDNRLANLSWGTQAKNLGPDKVRDGTDFRGERHPFARLTAEQVTNIRRRNVGGETCRALAREFGVTEKTVSGIVTGAKRPFDGSPDLIRAPQAVTLTDADVLCIRQRYAAGGVVQRELAADYGVSRGFIGQVIQGRAPRRLLGGDHIATDERSAAARR